MLWGVRDISLEVIFLGLGLSSWVNSIGTWNVWHIKLKIEKKKDDRRWIYGGRRTSREWYWPTKNVCISVKNNDSVILIKSNPGLSAMAKKIHRIIVKPEKTNLIVLGKWRQFGFKWSTSLIKIALQTALSKLKARTTVHVHSLFLTTEIKPNVAMLKKSIQLPHFPHSKHLLSVDRSVHVIERKERRITSRAGLKCYNYDISSSWFQWLWVTDLLTVA